MRISDWSSDVCSSDLIIDASILETLNELRRSVLRATLIQHFSRSPTRSEYPVMNAKGFAAVACLGLMPALAQARSEERRVGKSVSGRVDLGGGRIIKKKTKSIPQLDSN